MIYQLFIHISAYLNLNHADKFFFPIKYKK